MQELELYHHGIKGQKWGQRNGPPYPLRPGAHSAREKRLSRSSGGGSSESFRRKKNPNRVNELSDQSNNRVEGVSNTDEQKGLTDKQKKALKIAGAVAVGALAAYGGYRLYKSGKLDNVIKKGKEFLNDGESGLDSVKSSNDSYLHRSEVAESSLINPKYSTGTEYQINCANCSLAYEFRRRGYDVQPAPINDPSGGRTFDQVRKAFVDVPPDSLKDISDLEIPELDYTSFFKKSVFEATDEEFEAYRDAVRERGKKVYDTLEKELSKYPPGSRGVFGMLTLAGGHEMAWEVDKDGTAKILNPQNQSFFSDADQKNDMFEWFGGYINSQRASELYNINKGTDLEIIRTDQLKISNYGKKWLTTDNGKALPMSKSEKVILGTKMTAAVGVGAGLAVKNAVDKSKQKKKGVKK